MIYPKKLEPKKSTLGSWHIPTTSAALRILGDGPCFTWQPFGDSRSEKTAGDQLI
jgi:hypothetical protein